eukprot:gene9445-3423_t
MDVQTTSKELSGLTSQEGTDMVRTVQAKAAKVRELVSAETKTKKRKVPKIGAFTEQDIETIEGKIRQGMGLEEDAAYGGRMADAWN